MRFGGRGGLCLRYYLIRVLPLLSHLAAVHGCWLGSGETRGGGDEVAVVVERVVERRRPRTVGHG